MTRPSNWYDMGYAQQREWEQNERKHQQALDDAQYDAERQQRDAEDRLRAANARQRAVASERDELADEAGELRQQLAAVRAERARLVQWMRDNGHEETYREWLQKQSRVNEDDDA